MRLMDWRGKLQWTLMSCLFGQKRSGNTSRRGGQSHISPQTNCQSMHHGRSWCPTSRSSVAKCHVSGDWNNLPLGGHLSWQFPRTVAGIESFYTESNHEWISWTVSLPLVHHVHVQPKSLVLTWTHNFHRQWPNCWSPRIKNAWSSSFQATPQGHWIGITGGPMRQCHHVQLVSFILTTFQQSTMLRWVKMLQNIWKIAIRNEK